MDPEIEGDNVPMIPVIPPIPRTSVEIFFGKSRRYFYSPFLFLCLICYATGWVIFSGYCLQLLFPSGRGLSAIIWVISILLQIGCPFLALTVAVRRSLNEDYSIRTARTAPTSIREVIVRVTIRLFISLLLVNVAQEIILENSKGSDRYDLVTWSALLYGTVITDAAIGGDSEFGFNEGSLAVFVIFLFKHHKLADTKQQRNFAVLITTIFVSSVISLFRYVEHTLGAGREDVVDMVRENREFLLDMHRRVRDIERGI